MIAYYEFLRYSIEHKTVDEAVKKLLEIGVTQEWIDGTLAELGYNSPKVIAKE